MSHSENSFQLFGHRRSRETVRRYGHLVALCFSILTILLWLFRVEWIDWGEVVMANATVWILSWFAMRDLKKKRKEEVAQDCNKGETIK